AERDDDVDALGLELGHKPVEPFRVRLGGSVHEYEVLALGEAARGERGEKRHATRVERAHRAVGEQPQPIDLARLLRARCARPRRRGGAEKQDEMAAPHSITSSASGSSLSGISSPSALAAFRLITK